MSENSITYRPELKELSTYYVSVKEVYCPYFQEDILFSADGLHHLRFSGERERTVAEQVLKLTLFHMYAIELLESAGTVQEYRELRLLRRKRRYAKRKREKSSYKFWAFIGILGYNKKERIKIIIRQKGRGAIHFWSIMRAERHKGDEAYLYE